MFVRILFILLMAGSVGLNTLGQVLLKLGSGQNPLNFYLFGGTASYGLSLIIYVLVLGKFNLSVAYPVLTGLTMITTTACGAIILREKVAMLQWIGIGLTISGIYAIAIARSPS